MIKRTPIAFALLALIALPGGALAPAAAGPPILKKPCVPPPGLRGYWRGDDGGDYYVTTGGKEVYWVGVHSNTNGQAWTNHFTGTLYNGEELRGTWRDVRGGRNSGTLTFRVQGTTMVRTYTANNYFAGTRLTKHCGG